MSGLDIANRQMLLLAASRTPAAPASRIAARAAAAPDSVVDRNACRIGDASCATAHASAISRLASDQRRSVHRSLLRLQRQYGNQFVGRVLQRVATSDGGSTDMDAIERSIEQARGSGSGMDHTTSRQMEAAFGAKFTGVRIHTDSRADEMNKGLSARAFTTGRDVFFRQGEYNPGSSTGRELLAHELTHVVQQSDEVRPKMTVSDPADAHEREAEQMARVVVQQEHASMADSQVAARQEEDDQAVAAMHSSALAQRQPEAMAPTDEDEKKKALHAKRDGTVLSRNEDQPPD